MKMLFLFLFATIILLADDSSISLPGAEKKNSNSFGCSKKKCLDDKSRQEQEDNIELLLSPFHI